MTYEELKAEIISLLRGYIDQQEEDITTGVEEGYYEDDDDNRENIALFKKHRALVDEFERTACNENFFKERLEQTEDMMQKMGREGTI